MLKARIYIVRRTPERGEIPARLQRAKNKKGTKKVPFLFLIGGAEGTRTPDLLNAIQALSQLSYNPKSNQTRVFIAHKNINASKKNQSFAKILKNRSIKSLKPTDFSCQKIKNMLQYTTWWEDYLRENYDGK